jgi:membrane protein
MCKDKKFEETLAGLEEAENKLKKELDNIQVVGEKILAGYENITNIQKEMDKTKQIIISLQGNEKKKVYPKYDCSSPQSIFKEFRKVYREKCTQSKCERVRHAFWSPIQLIIIIFLISYILSIFFVNIPDKCKSAINVGYIICAVAFIIVVGIRILKKDLTEKCINKLDFILIILSLTFAIYFITYGLLNNSYKILEKLQGCSRIYLVAIIVLLFVLSCIDNAYKNFSKKEKENAVSSIEEVLGKEVSADLLKTLIKFQDEIGDGVIGEFKSSFICKLILFLGGGSLVLKLPDILNITNMETEFQLYIKLLIFFVVLFFLHHNDVYEEKIYLEGLKEKEFKEIIKYG